jgi:hypothetical protein
MFLRKNHMDFDDMIVPLTAFCAGKVIGLAIGITVGVMCRNRILRINDKLHCCIGNGVLQLGKKRTQENNHEEDSDYFTINNNTTFTEKIDDIIE